MNNILGTASSKTLNWENVPVRELVGRVRNVVLMNVYLDLGNPGGVGISGKGVYEPGEGNGEVSLRATWERGGWILSQQGGSK
jgi:hypothetical protein